MSSFVAFCICFLVSRVTFLALFILHTLKAGAQKLVHVTRTFENQQLKAHSMQGFHKLGGIDRYPWYFFAHWPPLIYFERTDRTTAEGTFTLNGESSADVSNP